MPLKTCKKVVGWPDGLAHFNITNEDGFLTCDWTEAAPPRVGDLAFNEEDGNRVPLHNCRVLPAVTFFAPQFKTRGDPIDSQPLDIGLKPKQQEQQCCQQCHNQQYMPDNNCRAWTITDFGTDDAVCWLASSKDTGGCSARAARVGVPARLRASSLSSNARSRVVLW